MAYVKTWSPIWLVGPLADRPLATAFRGTYTADDEDDGTTYRSDGVTWSQVGAGVSATGGGPVAADDVSVDSTTLVGVGTDVQAVLEELDNAVAASQPLDATLTALAAANWVANSVPVGTGADTLSQLSMGASTILARLAAGNVVAATPSQLRTLLALTIGTDVQAYDADLTTYAGITPSANVQSVLGAADYAAIRTLLGLVIGTNAQAWDADLDAVAALAPSNDDIVQRKAGAWTNRTMAQLLADLAPPMRFLPFRSGGTFYYGPAFGATANAAFTQSTLYAMPFYVPVTTTFDKIAVVCVTGAASSSVRLGIYSDTAGVPDALILDASTAATTSSSINAEKTISQALTPGWYWLACVSQGGAPTLQGCSGNNNNPVLGVPTANPFSNGPQHGYSQPTITAGLPSPWGATKTQQQALPIVWMVPH